MDAIVETYKEEAPDMVTGPHTPTEAAKICQCAVRELCHGALAGKPDGRYLDKLRTIHDATINNVNLWIQYRLTERTTAPTLHDLLHVLHLCPDNDLVLLKLDVKKAHRRIKVKRCDWKYITAFLKNQVWVNKCGTYGVASAQYYWGPMAALNLRLLYYLYPDIHWAFVYVDDFIIILNTEHHKALALAIILTMTAWGCPLSWKKTSFGEVSNWLGYQVNCRTVTSTMTPDKQIVMSNILHKLLEGAQHTDTEVVSNTGRLQWVTAICPQMRPFLQPLLMDGCHARPQSQDKAHQHLCWQNRRQVGLRQTTSACTTNGCYHAARHQQHHTTTHTSNMPATHHCCHRRWS